MLRLREDIPLFPQGRKKAFTLSSDDGVTQDGRLISLMKAYGIKGTFFWNGRNMVSGPPPPDIQQKNALYG